MSHLTIKKTPNPSKQTNKQKTKQTMAYRKGNNKRRSVWESELCGGVRLRSFTQGRWAIRGDKTNPECLSTGNQLVAECRLK